MPRWTTEHSRISAADSSGVGQAPAELDHFTRDPRRSRRASDERRDLDTAEPEFSAWKWVALDEVPLLIVDFKRLVYERIVAEFRPIAERIAAGD